MDSQQKHPPQPLPASRNHRRDHLRGKLVVLTLILLGLTLGLVSLPFRKFRPRPTTLPAGVPTTGPASRPA